MEKIKNLFNNLNKLDLKIMKIGLKMCFNISILSALILCYYLFFSHTSFFYELGITLFKLATYFSVEFVICGLIADKLSNQFN